MRPRIVIQTPRQPTQGPVADQAVQHQIDGTAAPEVQEVSGHENGAPPMTPDAPEDLGVNAL